MAEPKYHIIFRTCDLVHSLHHAPRPFDLDKRTLIKICFLSMYKSVEAFPHTIHIVGDRLSDEMLTFFARFPTVVTNEHLGNDRSILRSLEIALTKPDDEWVYFCEDDYLHAPECFRFIDDMIRNRDKVISLRPNIRFRKGVNSLRGKPLFIHPADYPDRYDRAHRQPSLIFRSACCHWRQITATTFTLLTTAGAVRQFKQVFKQSAKGANDHYLSRKLYGKRSFFGKGLCISPIPGLATHMHDNVMTPLVDWRKIVDDLSQ